VQQKAVRRAALGDLVEARAETGSTAQGNRELRLAQIILAAQQTFLEDGYAAFATRAVAARVGITLGNLQYYFRTKGELLRAALQAYVSQTVNHYTAIANQPGISATRRCSALVERIFFDINETDLPKFLFEIWAFAQHEPYAAELVDDMYAEHRSTFAKLLSEIQPTLTHEECLARASVIVVQTTGITLFAYNGGDSDKDYAECVRVTKQSVKMIVDLPPQALENDVTLRGLPTLETHGTNHAHSSIFISDKHGQDLFDLSARQTGQDTPYYRPTLQGKRRKVKVNEIVSTAANLLAAEGYVNFTLARVARELGIPESALRNYFPTHEDLLRSTQSALMKVYEDRYPDMGKPSGKPALERLCEILIDAFEEARDSRVCRFAFEMLALAQHSDSTRELTRVFYSTYRANYVDLVRELDASATARECHARATLIAAQTEGAPILLFGSKKQPLEANRIFELMKAVAIRVAQGNVGTKAI